MPVALEFVFPMREDEDCCFRRGVPCRDPVPMRHDRFGGQAGAEGYFDASDVFLFLGLLDDGEKAGEDVIEVDSAPGDEVRPLGMRELRACR